MLRHKIHFDDFLAVDRSVETREVLPKYKAPVVVQFVRDGDLKELVNKVANSTRVDLKAAVGAGKSTRIPMALARALGRLVIHTVPFGVSARSLAEYLATVEGGENVAFVEDVQAPLPTAGVMVTTNAYLHARIAHDRLAGVRNPVLYLDEVHESDAGTAVFRDAAPALKLFSCVVRASATQDLGVEMTAKLPGKRVKVPYQATSVSTWSASDVGKPWAASQIQGNTMIAMDRPDVRTRLGEEYESYGYDVRVCTSRTSYDYYAETVRRLKDPTSGIVVLLCDYAYRSSLTVPCLTDVIESGEVAVPVIEDGVPKMKYRAAYDFEVQQFLGRGGRLPGETVNNHVPADPAPKVITDLESLEGDAANILYRLLGFRPPVNLSGFDYYEGSVPIDIAAAMTSEHPLALCPEESRVPWVNGDRPVSVVQEDGGTYVYDVDFSRVKGKVRNAVSCHTVADFDRPVSPPPPVPGGFRVSELPHGFPEYVARGEHWPLGSGRVMSGVSSEGVVGTFSKPKRVSLRLSGELRAVSESTQESPPSVGVGTVGVSEARVHPERQNTLARRARVVPGLRPATMVQPLTGLSVDLAGSYVHYHGMADAPTMSFAFGADLDGLFLFAARADAVVKARTVTSVERLGVMRLLVDAYNGHNARVVGIQRICSELVSRPVEVWRGLMDEQELMHEWDALMADQASARSVVDRCNRIMPMFMDRPLDVVAALVEQEQVVMREIVARLDRVVVKKGPDIAVGYMRSFAKASSRSAGRKFRYEFAR